MSPLFRIHSAILALIYLLITFPAFQSYHWAGMVLYDLEYSGAAFDSEAAAWGAIGLLSSAKTYDCGASRILGGYGILNCCGNYFERTYTGLPAHNVVYFAFTMYPIDSWDGTTGGDHVELYLDGTTVVLWYLQVFASPYTNTDICGRSSFNDIKPIKVYSTVPHTSGSFTFRAISYLDQDPTDESFGLRDVVMTLEMSATPATSVSYCGISVDYPLGHNICGCKADEYMYPAGTGNCYKCDSTCATCSAGGPSACTSCPTGRFLVGGQCIICDANCATCSGAPTACTSCYAGMYLSGSTCYYCNSNCQTCVTTATTCTSCKPGWFMVGTTCYPTCNPPLYSSVSNGVTYCNTPCPGQYVWWDGSCSSSCTYTSGSNSFTTTPFSENTFAECSYPCGSNQYLYYNTSCLSTCPDPLTDFVYKGKEFCGYSCATNQYLYWNGSCLNNCPSPLSPETQGTINQRNFCWYTCQPGQYLYWNGSCLNDCPSPLSKETQGTNLPRQYCWYTCQPGQYLYWNGSCLNSCPSPLTPETQGTNLPRQYCWYTCQPNQYLYWNGSCLSTCPSPLSGETQGTYLPRQYCWYTCQPGEYLYWNGTCSSTCPSPLSGETQGTYLPRKYCWYTCQPHEYLYWNGTCSTTCPSPLTGETQGTYLERNFCWYICMPWQWLYWDQTCQEACNAPLWPDNSGSYMQRLFCWYPCTAESKFLYWNGTCLPECPKPLSTRYQNGQWFCDYPCATTGQFLYWNGSCLSSCDAPLAQRLEGNPVRQFCYYLCPVNQFLYWDGTCQSSCDFPLVPTTQGTPLRQFCWYLCPTTQFLYWNGTCSAQCDPPLTQRTTNSRKYCDYSCNADQYLAWNGTCINTCPYPLSIRAEGSPIKKYFCDFPCATTKYLYWNGTCLDSCDSPLSTRTEGARKFCDYLCVGNQYLYWNGTCKTTCDLPLVIRIEASKRYCDYLCPSNQIMYWDGSCGTSCSSPLVSYSQGTPSRNYCKYPCSASQFLYWNGTCSNTCESPLTSYIWKGKLFCKYPCTTTTQVLYFNGSCLNNCDSPFSSRTQGTYQYCDYPCLSSEFLYWNGSCTNKCASPLSQRIADDGFKYCDFPCSPVTNFLYWNGTCSSQCDSPLTQKQEGTKNFCVFSCPTGQYLYWNSSCLNSCDSPLTQTLSGDVKFCHYPCSDPSQYLYWNGSCIPQCDSPLSSRITAGLKYCDHPCSTSSPYLYWNTSCLSSCDAPLQSRTTSDNKQYCDFPCTTTTDYLYSGGTCLPTCDSPLVSKTEGIRKFCLNKCGSSDFAYWNGSCLSTCPFPFIQSSQNGNLYCNPPCSNSNGGYYFEELKACYNECKLPAYIDNKKGYLRCLTLEISTAGGSLSDFFLNAPLESGTVTIVKLVKVMQYVKYLDINMPPRLQRLGISKGRNVLSFSSGIKMSSALQEHFPKELLDYVYVKNELHSSFLVNYWEDLMNIIIIIALACLLLILEKICRAFDWAVAEVICQILRVVTKWNFALMAFAINIDDIILFAALELKSLNLPASNGVSLAMAVIFVCAVITLTALTYLYIAKVIKKKTILNNRWTYINRVSEDFQVLFSGFRDNSIFCQLFFILYMLRIGIPMLLAVCLEVTPIGNTILQVILSSAVLAFLIIKKPFIKKINHYQLVIFESVVLLMNFSMFLLTILSMLNKQNSTPAIVLADIVIIGNDIINLMCLVFLVIKLHIESKIILAFLKKHQVSKPEALGLWLQLIFVPLQLSHMGFEEMIAYKMASHPSNKKQAIFRRGHLGKQKPVYELENEFDENSFIPAKALVAESSQISTDRKRLLSSHRNNNKSLIYQRKELENVKETVAERMETFGDKDKPSSSRLFDINSSSRNHFEISPDTSRNLEHNSSDIILKNFNDENAFVFSTIINPKNPIQSKIPSSSSSGIKIVDTAIPSSPPQKEQPLTSQDSSRPYSSNNQEAKSRSSDEPSSSDQSNKQPKGILKNASLAQLDRSSDTINLRSQLESASVQSFYDDLEHLVSHNSPVLKASHKKSPPAFKLSNQEGNTQNRVKSYDDDNLIPEKYTEESSNSWNKVKRQFIFRDSSVDGRLRDHEPKEKSRIIKENMSFNLWKQGRKLFKPTK